MAHTRAGLYLSVIYQLRLSHAPLCILVHLFGIIILKEQYERVFKTVMLFRKHV